MNKHEENQKIVASISDVSQITIGLSFDVLSLLSNHGSPSVLIEKPKKPIIKGNTPDEFRKHADELEAYEVSMATYNESADKNKKLRAAASKVLTEKMEIECKPSWLSSAAFNIIMERARSQKSDEGVYAVKSEVEELIDLVSNVYTAQKNHK